MLKIKGMNIKKSQGVMRPMFSTSLRTTTDQPASQTWWAMTQKIAPAAMLATKQNAVRYEKAKRVGLLTQPMSENNPETTATISDARKMR